MKKTVFFFILITLLSLPLLFPFFRPGYFPTHDGEWAVVRLGAMHRALLSGHFPVRWVGNLNFSYGYPLFLFTYPLPYYLGEIFNLLGFGLVGGIKVLFVLSVIFSGWAMFVLGRELFGNLGGFLAAVFYLYAPFRLVDLYVRGSLGECLAFVFFPLVFWVLLKLERGGYFWISLGAVFWGSLLLTHNVSALLFAPFLVVFAALLILRASREKRMLLLRKILAVFILGAGLAAFFLIPALVEKKDIALAQMPLADISRHFVSLKQLVVPSWGYGSPGSKEAFSFQLGWVHWLGIAVGLVFWLNVILAKAGIYKSKMFAFLYRFRIKCGMTEGLKSVDSLSRLTFFFSLISLVILIFLLTPASLLFWQKSPLFSEIDFPWRALGLASFFMALGLGWLGQRSRFWLSLAVLAVLANVGYAKPLGLIDYGDDYYLTNEATTTSADELMPLWVEEEPTGRPAQKVEILSGEGQVKKLTVDGYQTSFWLEANSPLEVQINTIYFPGWQVKVNGQPTLLLYRNKVGVIRFKADPGKHWVLTDFGETPLRLLADAISLVSLMGIGGLAIFGIANWRRKYTNRHAIVSWLV